MKALGVALAACCAAVLWPSAAHANPIGAHVGAVTCALGAHQSGTFDADDATFTGQTGMDQSLHFAHTGLVTAFDDERTALADLISLEGLGVDLHKDVTLALRQAPTGHVDHDNDHDADDLGPHHNSAPPAPHGPKLDSPKGPDPQTSATPEPGSIVLLATGLVGLICLRRQIVA